MGRKHVKLVEPTAPRVVVSRCLNCHDNVRYPSDFVIPDPTVDEKSYICKVCKHKDMRYYEGKKIGTYGTLYRKPDESISTNIKGGNSTMSKDKNKKSKKVTCECEESSADESKAKKSRGYGADVKERAISLARQGKSLKEIYKALNGPGVKAIQRYLKSAGVEVTKK